MSGPVVMCSWHLSSFSLKEQVRAGHREACQFAWCLQRARHGDRQWLCVTIVRAMAVSPVSPCSVRLAASGSPQPWTCSCCSTAWVQPRDAPCHGTAPCRTVWDRAMLCHTTWHCATWDHTTPCGPCSKHRARCFCWDLLSLVPSGMSAEPLLALACWPWGQMSSCSSPW